MQFFMNQFSFTVSRRQSAWQQKPMCLFHTPRSNQLIFPFTLFPNLCISVCSPLWAQRIKSMQPVCRYWKYRANCSHNPTQNTVCQVSTAIQLPQHLLSVSLDPSHSLIVFFSRVRCFEMLLNIYFCFYFIACAYGSQRSTLITLCHRSAPYDF